MRILKVLLYGLMCLLSVYAQEPDSQQDNSKANQSAENHPLVLQIRGADSEFYKGVVLWSKNGDEASKYLKRACESKHPGACLYLANYYEQKNQRSNAKGRPLESQRYYKLGYENSLEACRAGAVEWCAIQAVALLDGFAVEQDIPKGLTYLETMCERDIEGACALLGSYYFYGIHVIQDLSKAKVFNQKALELDSQACNERRMYACVVSAEIYQQGLSVSQDLAKAKDYYYRACDLQNQFACDYANKLK